MYSQGYRVNWPPQSDHKLIVKTGGFFIKASPKPANVYINGNLAKKTDFFFGSCLVENLLPKNYTISIQKDGYQPWTKDLAIQEKQVTEVKRVILFPRTLSLSVLDKNVDSFWPSPDGKEIALLQTPTSEPGWQLSLYDTGQNLKSQLLDESDLSKTSAPIQSLEWANDSLSIKLTVTASKQLEYYSLDVQNPSSTPAQTLAPTSNSPAGSLAFASDGLTSYFIDQTGTVFKKDPLQSNPAKLNDVALPTGKDLTYKLWIDDQFVFARIGSDLYELKPGSTQFEKIFQGLVSDIISSPDGRKIAYASNSEIWVTYTKDKTDQPQKNAGDKDLIARLSKKVTGLAWFNSDYLIFMAGNSIKTAEIDNRDSINIANLTEISSPLSTNKTKQPSFKWDSANKNLYIFDGSNLYQSQINTD